MVIKLGGVLAGVNEKNAHVPVTVIPLESNLPPNPVRRLVFSQETFEQECVKVFNPPKKAAKGKSTVGRTNSGVTSLKAYSMEGLPPAEESVNSSGSWAGEMLTGLDGCNNLLGAVKLAANRRYPLAFTPESLWYSVMEGASLHMESEISRAGITLATSPKTGGGANRNQEIETTQTKDKQPDKLDWEEIVQSMGDFYKHKYHTYCYHFSTPPTEDGPEFGVAFDDDPGARIRHNPIFTTNGSTTVSATSMRLCRKTTGGQSNTEGSMTFKRYVVGVHDHIPEIHIKGTPENYQELIRKVEEMAEDLQLHWWAIELIPVLEQFLQAVQGNVDPHFWKYMINLNNKNGLYMPYSGWIQVFYPYVEDGAGNIVLNDFIGEARSGYNEVMPSKVVRYPKKKFPSSFCITNLQVQFGSQSENNPKTPAPPADAPENTPVIKNYLLRTGLLGILQNKDNRAVQPAFGFSIIESRNETVPPISPEEGQSDAEIREPVMIPVQKYKK